MKPITKFVILGGGTTGWIAAAILANQYRNSLCSIELVESEQIGSVGVGESTIPPFLELLQQLGINEKDFIQKTQASFKLGIKFVDWRVKGEAYFHPFGSIKGGMDEFTFYQLWLKDSLSGHCTDLQDYSVNSVMASQNKFFLPQAKGQSPLTEARYALHLDATLVAKYLRDYALEAGVKRSEGKVVEVGYQQQHINSITLDNGRQIPGDFFIDCSGFNALLIDKTLGVKYCDWSQYLPCDRAVVVQTRSPDEISPQTRSTANDAGWIWRIPLQSRVGNGYVYSSRYCSDEQARDTLLKQLDGETVTEPRILQFKTGMRAQSWVGNCLSLGLASGFIEPLESTAIHMVVRGMVHFMRNIPSADLNPVLQQEFNRRIRMDYEEIRDFIVLHYCLTERDDTPFWQYCKSMQVPESLRYTLDYFNATGSLPEMLDPLFSPVSWRSVCEGMGFRPQRWSPLIDQQNYLNVQDHFEHYRQSLQGFVEKLPSHSDFLRENCPANPG